MPRLRVAGLRTRRHRADLDEAEAQRRQRVDVRAVLVKPRGQSHRIGKVDAHHVHGLACRARQQLQQAGPVRDVEAGEGETVRVFGIETEQGGAQEGIKHGASGGSGHRKRV
jgi:hypothetical protein